MSSLLQEVLTSRLGASSLKESDRDPSSGSSAESTSPSELEHNKVAAPKIRPPGQEDEEVGASDDELVGVLTAPGTSISTPYNLSRPSSPPLGGATSDSASSTGGKGTRSKRSGLINEDAGDHLSKKRKTDPLRAFPSELSQRIFMQVPLRTLLSCSLVCKRWRRSATLNYCWYKHYQGTYLSDTFDPNDPSPSINSNSNTAPAVSIISPESGLMIPPLGSATAKWTRRESRTDWKNTYGKARLQEEKDARRLNSPLMAALGSGSSGRSTPSRTQRLADAGMQTHRDMREQQWAQEQAQTEYSKNEMREYYKSATNKGGKVKGKRAKGGAKTGSAADGGLWE